MRNAAPAADAAGRPSRFASLARGLSRWFRGLFERRLGLVDWFRERLIAKKGQQTARSAERQRRGGPTAVRLERLEERTPAADSLTSLGIVDLSWLGIDRSLFTPTTKNLPATTALVRG